MLEQIVYTRCFPHRNIEDGNVRYDDEGYGIHALSPGITTLNIDRRLLEKRLAKPNASSETQRIGLVNSYDFFPIGDDLNALVFDVARPCGQTPRSNGKKHRPGNFVKQGLLGRFDDYPFKWFGAKDWTAYKIPENDYYLDDPKSPQPPLMEQARSFPSNGNVDSRQVYSFIKEGRDEALKACVWFILYEFEKPTTKRKVLVVYDEPQNVELWVAAIELAFPIKAAQKISFSTNQGSVNELNVERTLFDQDDASNFGNQEESAETRTPRYMIVGISPQEERGSDKFEATLYSETLDGRAKSVDFQPDESIKSAFYSHITEPTEMFLTFRDIFLPSVQYNTITANLPQIFDAFLYWFGENINSPNVARDNSLEKIISIIPEENVWNQKLFDRAQKKYIELFSQDPTSAFSIVPAFCNLASRLQKEKVLAWFLVKSFFAGIRRRLIVAFDLSNILSTTDSQTSQYFFAEVFREESLDRIVPVLEAASEDRRYQTLIGFLEQKQREGKSLDSLVDVEQYYSFLLKLFVAAVKKDLSTREIMAIANSKRLFSRLIWDVFVKTNEEDANVAKRWINNLFQADPNVFERLLISGNYDKENAFVFEKILQILIEDKRVGILKAARFLERMLDRFGRTNNLGDVLFRESIENNPLNENLKLLQVLKKLELDANVQKTLISQFREASKSKRLVLFSSSFKKELDEWERNWEITVYQEELFYFKRRSVMSDAQELLCELERFPYPLDNDPSNMKDEFIRRIAAKTVQSLSYEFHLLLIDSFSFSSLDKLENFLDVYVAYALEYFEDLQLRTRVVTSLLQAARKPYDWKKHARKFENDAQNLLETIWRKQVKRVLNAESVASIVRAVPVERIKQTERSFWEKIIDN